MAAGGGDAEANTDDLCSPRRRFEEAKLQDQEAAEVLDGRSGTPLPLVEEKDGNSSSGLAEVTQTFVLDVLETASAAINRKSKK
mmetsp:Transcript_15435/g.32261  ORF Transcript_15435/g.32261 Transcript_15435/m.32261 type:complete len:84 (+) Transcript_15435:121-372(+)